MGTLTDHVAQLCEEIVGIRNQRRSLNQSLADETRLRKSSVSDLCSDFSRLRLSMARKAQKDRRAFLTNLRRTVHAQKNEVQVDLAGVRQAWAGK